ncbi:hypothetical protein [Streptomyces beijiangensis]|uniref:Uncharacterized protein n=1 Tax=Streptomyces beijiangensis TaxID=163361 RepID=A0A939FC36_9ACTN|nr:hypothetical protein [Streptomyces beijiangensis]MBO0514305.1 hypothetical protein [Streptomyces beijiangensis]
MLTSRLLWAGLAAVGCGALLCAAGWYGVSGERFTARQVPYLASCTVPGAALIVAGAVLLALAEVYGLLVADDPGDPAPVPPGPVEDTGPLVCLPGGTLAHRPGCLLVAGKPDAVPAAGRELAPCPVCEP